MSYVISIQFYTHLHFQNSYLPGLWPYQFDTQVPEYMSLINDLLKIILTSINTYVCNKTVYKR